VTGKRHLSKEAGEIWSGDRVLHFPTFGSMLIALVALAGCAPNYSPDTYATNAVQQANKVEPGVVIGYRQVQISASGTVGAVTGGAVGGILGAQADATGISQALGTLSGTLVGGIVGTTVEHAAGDTTGWEYIVRKPNGDLLSVTQREPTPLPIGQKVLVITGNQARVVADYSVAVDPPADKSKAGTKDAKETKESAPATASVPPSPNSPANAVLPTAPATAAVSSDPAPTLTPAAASTSVAASPEIPPAALGKSEDAAPAAPVAAHSDAPPQASSP
jgi:outer membrane lipoprotein SlyB